MAILADERALVEAVASEMSDGIEGAVNFWMTLIEVALSDPRLNLVGRMNAAQEILRHYRAGTDWGSHDGHVA